MDMSLELYKQIREDAHPTEITLCGRQYATRNITPVEEPTPDSFKVTTLTGLVDYLKANVDKLNIEELICHVQSPTSVSVFSALHGNFKQRSYYIRAAFEREKAPFNKFLPADKFNVFLQSGFIEMPCQIDGELKPTGKGILLKYVGNIKSEVVSNLGDDGVSQEITIRASAARNENVILPNPVVLRPYRTFNEVEQPASSFVFRAQSGPEFALHEADNGAWEGEAMKNIKNFLEFEVPGLTVIA